LPWITDYHLLKNKRYILTNNSEKKIHLWSLDSLSVVKQWTQKTFAQVQKVIADDFDIGARQKQQTVPSSWFSIDIKLGVRSGPLLCSP
jgi:hypothetical protein